jgi:hypothetical protein
MKEVRMNKLLWLLWFPLLACAGAAFAGLYDQPYSIIETDRAPAPDPLLLPVIVNRVDGENALPGKNKAVVAPGEHEVTVDVPPRGGFKTSTQRTFHLTTQACWRYYVAAKLHTTTGQEWEPVVRSREPMGDCEAKFAKAPATK